MSELRQNPPLPSLQERAAGMLAGVALGDALGMPAEFLTRSTIREWYGELESLRAADSRHPHRRLPPGSVTDDTDHTWLLARLLLEQGEIAPGPFASALLEWSRTPRVRENNFVGPSTRRTLEALQAGAALESLPRKGVTVGAAMRTAPLAIAFPARDKLARQVIASCALTHYTHLAISGAMAMAFAQAAALAAEASVDAVLVAMQQGAIVGREYGDWSWRPPIDKRIQFVIDWVSAHNDADALDFLADVIGTDYYPEQLLPCAAGLLRLSGAKPMLALRLAVNLGGDTDTLASMLGSLCGGLNGIRAFDPGLLQQVEAVNGLNIEALARDLLALRAKSQQQRRQV